MQCLLSTKIHVSAKLSCGYEWNPWLGHEFSNKWHYCVPKQVKFFACLQLPKKLTWMWKFLSWCFLEFLACNHFAQSPILKAIHPARPPTDSNKTVLSERLLINLIKVILSLNPDYYIHLYGRIKINFLSYNKCMIRKHHLGLNKDYN